MGLFSSKKTYSGVGSAVQNLLANELTNNLNTVTYSAILNNNDIGETFKNYLKSGTGSRLRSLIDYAHQKGYTDTLGWKVSDITGEVFSDSTAYTNYLHQYVYPTTIVSTDTGWLVQKDTNSYEDTYYIGNDVYTTKTYTRTKTKTTTSTSTNYNFTVNLYYQGSHSEFRAVNNTLNSEVYNSLPDSVKDSALLVNGKIRYYDISSNGSASRTDKSRFGEAISTALYLMPEETNLTPTIDGLLICSEEATLNERFAYSYKHNSHHGEGQYTATTDTLDNCLTYKKGNYPWFTWTDTLYYDAIHASVIQSPYSTLNLNSEIVQVVKIQFLLSAEQSVYDNATGGAVTEDTPSKRIRYKPICYWFSGYGLISTYKNSSDKILVSNISIEKIVTKTTTNIVTEFYVTERYKNGELVSFEEVEGAITSTPSTVTLEDTAFSHKDTYTYGTGNSKLDTIINNTKSITEQFMPIMPIKTWGNLSSKDWGDLYTAERKLYKKLSGKTLGKWDEFVESFKDVGDDAKMIYYFPAIPINVDHEFANEYFFHFFKWLAVNFNGMNYFGSNMKFGLYASQQTDFMVGYQFKLTYRVVAGTPPIACKIHNYARLHVIGTDEPNDNVNESWQGGFKDYYRQFIAKSYNNFKYSVDTDGSGEDTSDGSVETNSGTFVKYQNINKSSLTFYYRINDHLYEKIYLTEFVFYHYVRGTALNYFLKNSLSKDWRAAIDDEATNTANAGFSPIIIPIARGALESMGWYRQSNILEVCHNVIVSGYDQKTIKTKWYQSAFFSIVLIIAVVVISIYCFPAGAAATSSTTTATTSTSTAGAVTASAGAGSVAAGITIAKLADLAIQAIACALIAKVITYAADKYLGGVFGTIVGVIATVVACYYATGYYQQNLALSGTTTGKATSLWDYLNSWDGYMELTKTTLTNSMDYLNTMQQNQFNELANQYNAFYQDQAEKSEQMRLWTLEQNSYGKSIYTDIITYNTYTSSSYNRDAMSFTLAEDPDTFHKRTMDLPLRYQEASQAYVYQFEDLTNSLIIA